MRPLHWVTVAVLLASSLAGAAPPVAESDAVEAVDNLSARIGGYGSRHPDAAGAFAPWSGGRVEAGTPLLVHSYPALEPSCYYVPLTSPHGASFATLDAATGQWQAFGRRSENFPSVTREDAARAAGELLGFPVTPEDLVAVSMPDRSLYWHLRSPVPPDPIFISVSDVTDTHSGAGALLAAPGGVTVPPASDGATGTTASAAPTRTQTRPDPDYPPSFDIPDVPHHYQITSYHCGPATVQMLMDYWGPEIDQEEIGEVADTHTSGTAVSDMLRAAQFSAISTAVENPDLHGYDERRLGYGGLECHWSKPDQNDPDYADRHHDLKRLISASYPVIIVMRYAEGYFGSHARVAKGYDDSTGVYIVHDPWYANVYQGPDIHFNQDYFDDLWGGGYRWGGFIAPWKIDVDAPAEALRGAPFTVTAHVLYTGPHPFGGQDRTEFPTVTLMPNQLCELAPGESATKTITGHFSDSGCAYDPVSWQCVADSLSQTGTLQFLARGLLHDSSSSYASYSDSIGGRAEVPLAVIDPDLVTVSAAGAGHFTNIQDALDFVTDGDTVHVYPGTYSGSRNRDLTLGGKGVLIRGVEGPAATAIDCEGAGRGFLLTDGEGPDVVIEGLTVVNGRAPDTERSEGGGGIYLNGASPTIRNVILEANSSPGAGGGMCCVGGASPVLERVEFVRNKSDGEGGGLSCFEGSNPRLERCTFLANESASRGGAVATDAAAPRLVNCTLALNTAPGCGGVFCRASSPLLVNTIIYGSPAGGAVVCEQGAAPVVISCCVYGNAGGDGLPGSCCAEGTLYADPLLCDPARGALQLQECSPCIGSGASGGDVGALPPRCACEQSEVVPGELFLHAARPSPFGVATVLQLDVPARTGPVTLSIYDISGRLVRTLVDRSARPGERQYVWRGDDDSGSPVGSGVYFARCECGTDIQVRKLVLTR